MLHFVQNIIVQTSLSCRYFNIGRIPFSINIYSHLRLLIRLIKECHLLRCFFWHNLFTEHNIRNISFSVICHMPYV